MRKPFGTQDDYECFIMNQMTLYSRHIAQTYGLPDPAETAQRDYSVQEFAPKKIGCEACDRADHVHIHGRAYFTVETFRFFDSAPIKVWVRKAAT